MIISLVLALLATASGTITTYLYDESASFASRLCAGACVGLAALGLIGFLFASFLGLTPLAIALTTLAVASSFLVLRDPVRWNAIAHDLSTSSQSIRRALFHPSRAPIGYILFYAAVSVILWRVFSRAMIEMPDGISTGVLNNFGDLPFHLSVITSFAYGNNFPPEDPTYAGVRFTYPFLTDFVSAIFVRCGADLRQSMFIENFILGVSFVGLLHRWALELVRDRLAAVLTPLLVILNGGLGWILLWPLVKQNAQDPWEILNSLPSSLTIIPDTTWRWGNAISTLLVPQRGMLLGLPLAVIVFTQWWLAEERLGERGKREEGKGKRLNTKKRREKTEAAARVHAQTPFPLLPFFPLTPSAKRMIAAGIIAGLLPLVHAHSFVVVMVVGACIALIQQRWRDWILFFVAASLVALPQIWWSTHNSSVNAGSFFDWQFGWDRGKENPAWFWLKNTGLFIPLIVAAILWRGKSYLVSRRLLLFYLPFTLCFIVPNLVKMAPWVWDNIKILFYWWLASAPLVALLLARLWHQRGLRRILAVGLFICLTLAGSVDVGTIVLRSAKYQVFDRPGIQFAEIVKRVTEPRALIVHAPVHNHPVFLTGRRSLMGYPGHIWTHGLEYLPRESEIKRLYAGSPAAVELLRRYDVKYAVVGPHERNVANVNDQFFSRFTKVGEVGGYRLYKIAQP
jgi:cytochrome b